MNFAYEKKINKVIGSLDVLTNLLEYFFIDERNATFVCFRNKYVVLVTIMFGISGFCIIGFSELRSLWMATSSNLGTIITPI